MVIKQPSHSEPPEIDEAWWTALLAEEQKYDHRGTREPGRAEDFIEKLEQEREIAEAKKNS